MNEFLMVMEEAINNNSNIDNYFEWLNGNILKLFQAFGQAMDETNDAMVEKLNVLGSNMNGRFDILTNEINAQLSAIASEVQFLKIAVILLLIFNVVVLFGGWKMFQRLKRIEGELENEQSNNAGDTGNRSVGA